MMRKFLVSGMGIALGATAACTDLMSSGQAFQRPDLSAAYYTIPVAYSTTQSTYDASAEGTGAFMPHMDRGGMGHGPGPDMGGGMGPMIGNNLGDNFLGGKGLGRDMGHGRHGDPDINASLTNCTFNAGSGRVECAADTRNGITTLRSVGFTNAAGAAQSAFDSVTTNTINTIVTVSGTFVRRDSSVTTLSHNSNRTVTGLAAGSTRHTINATSAGTESSTGTNRDGAFTANRVASDTISGLIVPVADTGKTYPIAGTVIRNMSVARTVAGTTSTRSEEHTSELQSH